MLVSGSRDTLYELTCIFYAVAKELLHLGDGARKDITWSGRGKALCFKAQRSYICAFCVRNVVRVKRKDWGQSNLHIILVSRGMQARNCEGRGSQNSPLLSEGGQTVLCKHHCHFIIVIYFFHKEWHYQYIAVLWCLYWYPFYFYDNPFFFLNHVIYLLICRKQY